jgi:hypothetical protein
MSIENVAVLIKEKGPISECNLTFLCAFCNFSLSFKKASECEIVIKACCGSLRIYLTITYIP